MPSEPAEPVKVEFTPEFKRNLRALAKKYRHIRSDVQPMIDQLWAGAVMGDQVPKDALYRIQGASAEQRHSKRQTFWLSHGLPPQNAHKHHSCDDLFQVGSGGHFGGADSAHYDRV